jgi:hypothetical protein
MPFRSDISRRWKRLALALVLSLVACGAAQHAMMVALGEVAGRQHYIGVFIPLAGAVAAVTAVFAAVTWNGRYAGLLTLVLLAVMAGAGWALYVAGVNSRSPGIGGTVFYGVAYVVVLYYLAPCAAAVPIHWLMLRKG